MQSNLPKVAFVCVHNACRSQIAEALGRLFAADVFDSFSAGTAIAPAIQPDAVRLVRERYGIDMAQHQRPKPLDALPDIDVLVTMGCNVECPHVPAHVCLDWGLEDPTGGTMQISSRVSRISKTLSNSCVKSFLNCFKINHRNFFVVVNYLIVLKIPHSDILGHRQWEL